MKETKVNPATPAAAPRASATFLDERLRQYLELLWNLVARNLKVRYKNSTLGFFWTLLNPLSAILIWYLFIRLARFPMDLAGLLGGLIAWHFLSLTLSDSVETISGNATLITKVRFPRIILPLSTALANGINFLLSLAVLIVCLPLLGHAPSWNLLWLPAIVVMTFIFVTGLSLVVATANVYFKDTAHILGIGLQAWFFMTPIIYPRMLIPERFRDWVDLNPMATLVSFYRGALLQQPVELTGIHGLSGLIALGTLYLGFRVFRHFEPLFADEL